MTVHRVPDRPEGHRGVPLLHEPDLGHYPEFATFLTETFERHAEPFRPPAIVAVDDRHYELTFTGRSGRPFPAGLDVSALVSGLEPLNEEQADRDLFELAGWSPKVLARHGAPPASSTPPRYFKFAPRASTDECPSSAPKKQCTAGTEEQRREAARPPAKVERPVRPPVPMPT